MAEQQAKPVGITSSKNELLAAYKQLQRQLAERRQGDEWMIG